MGIQRDSMQISCSFIPLLHSVCLSFNVLLNINLLKQLEFLNGDIAPEA